MNISTKTGDRGTTSLLYGRRIKKDSLRIEACGTLDELNSFIGLCKNLLKDKRWKDMIVKIQEDVFTIGSETACRRSDAIRLKKRIGNKEVKDIEACIEKLEKRCKCRKFVLPGTNTLSAHFDIARTIARRAERRIVALRNRHQAKNRYVLIYLNRLSDLLFLLARCCDKR